ncbi:interleukin-17 receptor A-like [Xenopus laevis]|uniref:Interleukin-17 receptor A-like n=1 Tax=Xenopus laevis TaxID=8355 RepID=A0A8J1MHZ6_XENLA|nr:interleukin-17 receptor A-like [Xenopus laevis]
MSRGTPCQCSESAGQWPLMWQFVCSNFKVDPEQMYDVTVQHLPRLVNSDLRNSKEMSIIVPGFRDKRMSKMKTFASTHCHSGAHSPESFPRPPFCH